MVLWIGPFPPCPPIPVLKSPKNYHGDIDDYNNKEKERYLSDCKTYKNAYYDYNKLSKEYSHWNTWYMRIYRWFMKKFKNKDVGVGRYYKDDYLKKYVGDLGEHKGKIWW